MLKKAKISLIFIFVCIVSLVIWLYIKDPKIAAIVFFGYIVLRILLNFWKKEPKYDEY